MTPRGIITKALSGARKRSETSYEDIADRILQGLATHGFVVVSADRVVRQDGKVAVNHALLDRLLENAEALRSEMKEARVGDYKRFWRLLDEAIGALKSLSDEARVKGEPSISDMADHMAEKLENISILGNDHDD